MARTLFTRLRSCVLALVRVHSTFSLAESLSFLAAPGGSLARTFLSACFARTVCSLFELAGSRFARTLALLGLFCRRASLGLYARSLSSQVLASLEPSLCSDFFVLALLGPSHSDFAFARSKSSEVLASLGPSSKQCGHLSPAL